MPLFLSLFLRDNEDTLFFFSYRIFFGVLSLRKRGRCDRLNRGGIDCIGMARGKDDGTAFAVDERGNGEV
jgi:hypothetical protein